MDDGSLPLSVALLAGAAAYLGVAGYVWSHRHAVAARALTVLTLAAGVWTLCYALEVSVTSPQQAELWGGLKFLGIVTLPPAMWAFALEYTGRRRHLRRREVALLLIEPAVVLAALAVPATRALVRSVTVSPETGAFEVSNGAVFWVHLVYSYALMLAATVVLVASLLRVTARHRPVAAALIVAVLLPMGANVAYNLGLPGLDVVDLTPIGFSLTGFVLVWGLFRFRLLNLIPVGRTTVVDRIPDAVLVLDSTSRVADVNPAALSLLELPPRLVIGHGIQTLMPGLTNVTSTFPSGRTVSGGFSHRRNGRPAVELAATVSPLPDEQQIPVGWLLVLRDVTAQRHVEHQLRQLVDERTTTISVLQRGLYPERLPSIPGVDIAALLSPAEADTNVGGDFVDVRSTSPRQWTLIIGDVVGKGADAATLTALARHTTLALSSLGWQPSRVLAEVSHAITAEESSVTRQARDPRFCTMALATLEPRATTLVRSDGTTADVPAGADIVLSLGGHPRPLLLTAAGGVTEVGVPGTLLGIVENPELHDVRLRLRPGDALLLFTDGVTEARRGPDVFGDQRLRELMAGLGGLPAHEVATRVLTTVREFGGADDPRDDVAVLAVVVPGR